MQKDDGIRLRHMLDAACEAVEFAKGRSRVEMNDKRMLVLSLIKELISKPY